jgi:hypothetical protein
VLHETLEPFVETGAIRIFTGVVPVSTDAVGDRVRSVLVRDELGSAQVINARYFLDATETGELLPLTGTEYVTGAESRAQTGEPHAPTEAEPENHQAITCCFAISHHPGEDHTIEKPAEYAFWRDYLPNLTPPWPGRLLSLTGSQPITLQPKTYDFDPVREPDGQARGFWNYRRILDSANVTDGRADICLVNWPMNDYWLGNVVDVSEDERNAHVARAKQLSLSILYWLQTKAPRSDGGTGWKGLKLRPDVVGTEDGIAKRPYIRESRRIRAEFTVCEQHVGTDARMAETGMAKEEVRAAPFHDSVGVGAYRIDLHPTTGGNNYLDVSSLPFQIPLGALLPARIENLLPACKNLGVTHITNGCYRLHPVEWNIGEAAGALAAHCVQNGLSPRQVRNDEARLNEFQSRLNDQGFELFWPESVGPL